MTNFKVTFHLDGTGIIFNRHEPIHLDDLLNACLSPLHRKKRGLSRTDTPDDIPLPVKSSLVRGVKVYHASSLFPEGPQFEDVLYLRRRFDGERAHLTNGTYQLTNGANRNYNMPFQQLLIGKLSAYAVGKPSRTISLLKRNIRGLGKKRLGTIVDITAETISEDWSFVKNGRAMRWLPDEYGFRDVRPRPPYFNTVGRIRCCEIGDSYDV